MPESAHLKPAWEKTDHARHLFKEALRTRTPKVLISLHDDVLPAYKALTPSIAKRSYASRKLRRLAECTGPEIDPAFAYEEAGDLPLGWVAVKRGGSRTKETKRLKTSLEDWASRFNLSADWILDSAVQSLFAWNRSGADRNDLHWEHVPLLRVHLNPRPLEFGDPGWLVDEETWPQFNARVMQEFRTMLSAYRANTIAHAQENGWTPPPLLREKQHFEWLALFQVRNKSPKDIAREFVLTKRKAANIENTVLAAVRHKASLIGLALRSGKSGPKKRFSR